MSILPRDATHEIQKFNYLAPLYKTVKNLKCCGGNWHVTVTNTQSFPATTPATFPAWCYLYCNTGLAFDGSYNDVTDVPSWTPINVGNTPNWDPYYDADCKVAFAAFSYPNPQAKDCIGFQVYQMHTWHSGPVGPAGTNHMSSYPTIGEPKGAFFAQKWWGSGPWTEFNVTFNGTYVAGMGGFIPEPGPPTDYTTWGCQGYC